MATCLCLSNTSTYFSTIHPNNKASISKSEIDSMIFGFFCVISDKISSGIHYCLHTMGSRSYVTTIYTPPQPSPDVYIDAMYAVYPGIIYVYLVVSVDASCSSCRIPPTNCLTAVDFSRVAYHGYYSSNAFTGMNITFSTGMPIFACRNFPMTEQNILKSTPHLWFISFRGWNVFCVYLVLVQFTFLLRNKSTLALPFLFTIGLCPCPILLLMLGMGCHLLFPTLVVKLCVSYGEVLVIGV